MVDLTLFEIHLHDGFDYNFSPSALIGSEETADDSIQMEADGDAVETDDERVETGDDAVGTDRETSEGDTDLSGDGDALASDARGRRRPAVSILGLAVLAGFALARRRRRRVTDDVELAVEETADVAE